MSVAAKVELYVSKKPYLKEALAEGVVNYSALARKICREKGIESEDAVKAAVSRYEDHVSRQRKNRRSQVQKVLEDTSMEVKPGLEAVKEQRKDAEVCAETQNGFTSVIEGKGKALISLESPEALEEVPGVIEFILSSLAAEGINVDQLISCREDTHLLIDENDASEAMDLLRERL